MPRVLLVGSGGREHALALGLLAAPSRPEVFVAPGSDAIAKLAGVLPAATGVAALEAAAVELRPDLVVVGPEGPLVEGLGDRLRARGLPVLGPDRAAARLEGDKGFAKEVMVAAGVPTAAYVHGRDPEALLAFARLHGGRVAVKAVGLARGKGVIVTDGLDEAAAAIAELSREFGPELVVEERLVGREISLLCLVDGERAARLPLAQDHKRLGDGDRGPNTGGMGAVSPVSGEEALGEDELEAAVIHPIVRELARRGTPFVGVLYAGVMLTAAGPRVLEYNVRFGDPEAQVIVPRIDEDLYVLLLRAATGRLEARPVATSPRAAVCVVLAAAGYPGAPRAGDPIEGLERVRDPDVQIVHAGTAEVAGRWVTRGGRVLGVTGLGATRAAAIATAYAAVDRIEFAGRQLRRDIGAG